MWLLVLGVVVAGVAAYELLTHPTTAEAAVRDARAKALALQKNAATAALTGGLTPAAPSPPDAARALACGLQPGDFAAADEWSAQYLGRTFAPLERLQLMRSVTPVDQWPFTARRVYCAYLEQAPLQPQQVPRPPHQHWG